MKSLPEYIAHEMLHGRTRQRFTTMHQNFLMEKQNMSKTSCTTTGMRPGDDEAARTPVLAPVTDNPDRLGVHAENPGAGNTGTINSGLSCGSQLPDIGAEVKPVDRRTIEGSTPGDFRSSGDTVKATMDSIANPPSPREQMRGQQNSRNYHEDGKAFTATETPDVGD